MFMKRTAATLTHRRNPRYAQCAREMAERLWTSFTFLEMIEEGERCLDDTHTATGSSVEAMERIDVRWEKKRR